MHFCVRRRYDPAASRLASPTLPSVLSARLQERREGSHPRAALQFVAVAGIRISFQLLAEIPGIFFSSSVVVPPPLPESNPPPLVALSPAGCVGLLQHECFQKCVLTAGKRDFTTAMRIFPPSLAHIPASDR